MPNSRTAFTDVMLTVATANTAQFLFNRIEKHPIVQYLVDSFSMSDLLSKYFEESAKQDRSIQQTTIVLTLVQAILNKVPSEELPATFKQSARDSTFLWVKDLLLLNLSKKKVTPATFERYTFKGVAISNPLQPRRVESSYTSAKFA
jgi:hypothetical protein